MRTSKYYILALLSLISPFLLTNAEVEEPKDAIEMYAPWVLLIILFFIILLYLSAYFSRYIKSVKIKGSALFDDATLDFINTGGQYLMVIIFAIIMVWVGSLSDDWLIENIWRPFSHYVPYILPIAVLLFFSTLIMMVIHRMIMNLRDEVRDDEEKVMRFRILGILDIILKWTVNLIVWVIVILISLAMIGLHEQVTETTTTFLEEKLASIIFIIVWIFIIYFISRTLESFLTDIKKRSTTISPQMVDLSGTIIRYGLWIFTVILIIYTVLNILDLSGIGTFVMIFFAIIFVLGAVILLVTPLRNIFSGITIINLKPFETGDRIQLEDGTIYDILEIGFWFTKVRTPFGEETDVPNDNLLKGKITNFSKEGKTVLTVALNVDSQIPFKTVEHHLKEAASSTWGVDDRPIPRVFAREFEGRSIRYDLVVYTKKIKRFITVRSRLIASIQERFNAEKIPIFVSTKYKK